MVLWLPFFDMFIVQTIGL